MIIFTPSDYQQKKEKMDGVKKVLIIYTGGTIGMKSGINGFAPVAGYLSEVITSSSSLHDASKNYNTQFALPEAGDNAAFVGYDLLEYIPLMDSSNMYMADWIKIAADIEKNYSDYDSFIVLHGTDTMAYTASALSFMLKDLTKTIILTGSQIPLSQLRNDAIDNLLGALIIAGNFEIPEVCIYFNNKLLRGNRTEKVSASKLGAFKSANYPPLVNVGIDMVVDWKNVLNPPIEPRFQVQKEMSRRVSTLRIFPGITKEAVLSMGNAVDGLVLHSYGTGNAPMSDEFLSALKELSDNDVIILNCTQCLEGRVEAHYETGKILASCGVVSGADMTIETAITKMSYLLAQELNPDEVKKLLTKNLRGELTEHQKISFSFKDQAFIKTVADVLNSDKGEVKTALEPILLCACASLGDLTHLKSMIDNGADINQCDYDKRTVLHVAASRGNKSMVTYLLAKGADKTAIDNWGNSPYRDAQRNNHHELLPLLI